MLPSTLEWHAAAFVVAISGVLWTPAFGVAGAMLFLSVVVAALQAAQARLTPVHDGPASRLVVAVLCYLQPLVRSWKRYKTRFLHPGIIIADDELPSANGHSLSWTGRGMVEYWNEKWTDRTELLNTVVQYLTERRWAKVVDPGWSDRDLVIYCHPWTEVRVCSVQEDHGSGRRLIRVRFQMCPRASFWLAIILSSLTGTVAAVWLGALSAVGFALPSAIALLGVWRYAAHRSGRAVSVFDHAATKLELICCQ
jgi:hypothetical protein